MIKHHSTARRSARLTPNGTHVLFMDGRSLWPMNWQGEGWEWGSTVSRLHMAALAILRNDPEVTAVTTLEW